MNYSLHLHQGCQTRPVSWMHHTQATHTLALQGQKTSSYITIHTSHDAIDFDPPGLGNNKQLEGMPRILKVALTLNSELSMRNLLFIEQLS